MHGRTLNLPETGGRAHVRVLGSVLSSFPLSWTMAEAESQGG